jgi:hypothetical protein
MSIRLMSAVWDSKVYRGSTLLVLLSLADCANEHGVCWPSVATLARKARLSHRSAERIVSRLISDGLVSAPSRTGPGSTHYTLNLQALIPQKDGEFEITAPESRLVGDGLKVLRPIRRTPEPPRGVPRQGCRGDPDNAVGGTPTRLSGSSEPPMNRQRTIPPTAPLGGQARNNHYSPDFQTFWAAYPRQVGKPKAWRAWQRKIQPGELAAILTALGSMKPSVVWTREAGRFIPYPATFLYERRWEDRNV